MADEQEQVKAQKKEFYDRHSDFLSKLQKYAITKEDFDKPTRLKNEQPDTDLMIEAAKKRRMIFDKERNKKNKLNLVKWDILKEMKKEATLKE